MSAEESVKRGKKYALWLLSRASMHSHKLDFKLKEKEYDEETRKKVLQEMQDLGFIHDAEYVARFVELLQKRGKSWREIIRKASEHKIPLSEIQDRQGDDQAVLLELIRKRYPVLLDKGADFKLRAKALQALYRRGFSHEVLRSDSFY